VADSGASGKEDDSAVFVGSRRDAPALGADQEASKEDQKGQKSRHGGLWQSKTKKLAAIKEK
jgi:hypothetical protein